LLALLGRIPAAVGIVEQQNGGVGETAERLFSHVHNGKADRVSDRLREMRLAPATSAMNHKVSNAPIDKSESLFADFPIRVDLLETLKRFGLCSPGAPAPRMHPC
jgi:hypothetical protein